MSNQDDLREVIRELVDAINGLMGRHPTWKESHAATMKAKAALEQAIKELP